MRLRYLFYFVSHLLVLGLSQSSESPLEEEALARRTYFFVGGRYENAVSLKITSSSYSWILLYLKFTDGFPTTVHWPSFGRPNVRWKAGPGAPHPALPSRVHYRFWSNWLSMSPPFPAADSSTHLRYFPYECRNFVTHLRTGWTPRITAQDGQLTS